MGVYLNPSTKEFTDKIPKKTFVDQTELLALVAEKINDTGGCGRARGDRPRGQG